MAIGKRAKYTHARAKFRGDATRGERQKIIIFGAPLASRLFEISRARVCILPALQSPSPKLKTTCSLTEFDKSALQKLKQKNNIASGGKEHVPFFNQLINQLKLCF